MKRINEKINELKDNKKVYIEYIKCFAQSSKASELYFNNSDFNKMKKYLQEKKEF